VTNCGNGTLVLAGNNCAKAKMRNKRRAEVVLGVYQDGRQREGGWDFRSGTEISRPGQRLRTGAAILMRGLGAFTVLLVEIAMAIVGAGELAFNEKIFHLGTNFERVAVRHDQVGDFARLDGSEPVA